MMVRHTRDRHDYQPNEIRWPDVSRALAEVDDDSFTRAIAEGRRRELSTR